MTRPGESTRTPVPARPAAALAALVVGCAVVLTVPAVPASWQSATTNLVQLAVAALACATSWWRARRSTGHRRSAWAWAAAGCGGWAAGQLVWCWFEVVQQRDAPFPSVADAGFLLLPLAMSVALFRFAGPAGWGQRRRVLDALTVTTALAMVSWAVVLRVVVQAGGDDPVSFAVSLAYPAGDVVLLVLTLLMLTSGAGDRWALGLLGGGLLAFAVADSAFALQVAGGGFSSGEPASVGWVLGFALMALAPLAAADGPAVVDAGPEQQRNDVLPYLAAALAVLVVVGRQLGDGEITRGEEFLARLTAGLVLLRQFVTLRENRQLVDELAAREGQLRHQAFHDGLTGLANRALFTDRLAHALELHRSDLRPLAVLLCDLDDFKVVNDTLGHAAGDELLQRVSERLRGALRSADTLARLGGDEFAVLLEHGDQAETTAARVVDALTAPFVLEGSPVTVRASVGVAVVPATAATPDPGALLGQADTAMYAAKRSGKRQVRVFEPGMSLVEVQEGRLADALRAAVAAGRIDVVFQPVVTVETGVVEGVECLARWTWEGRLVPPSEFVPVAERTGLVADLTDLVLERACAQLVAWDREVGRTDLRVGVNVAPQDLVGGTLPGRVTAALARHGVDADRLVLEITETGLLTDLEAARTASAELRRAGVRLALDDFGVGYSSLAHLHAIPLQILKIDRRFTAGLGTDSGQARFVRALLALGRDLGLHVVAEGVERPDQLAVLRSMGCDMAQGYLLARPSSPEQLRGLLADGVPALTGLAAAGRRTRALPAQRLP